jgi:hypothetical protein
MPWKGRGQLEDGMALLAKPFELSTLTERVRTLVEAAAREQMA